MELKVNKTIHFQVLLIFAYNIGRNASKTMRCMTNIKNNEFPQINAKTLNVKTLT